MSGNLNLEVPAFFRPHPTLFWDLVPGVDRAPGAWGDVVSAEGLRMRRAVGARRERVRVACFGDSCTYGLGLGVDEAWPSLLDRDPDVEAINGAVPGYSSYQGARCAALRGPEWKPDVVVVEFGLNDANVWPSMDGDEVVALSDRERAKVVRLHAIADRSALLSGILSLTSPPKSERLRGLPAGSFEGLPPRVAPEDFRENLLAIAATAPRAIVLLWPRRHLLDPATRHPVSPARYAAYEEAMLACRSDRIDVLDLRPVLARLALCADELFLDEVHGTERLSRIVAGEVRARLR